jgi:mannose-1-phosphate guanylyltransferase/mannose-6-phosphate isomerase
MSALVPVVLAGGVGTRLWPLSRTHYPKQFLNFDGHSLFQKAYLRGMKLSGDRRVYVVTNEAHQYLVRNQIEALGYHAEEAFILLEPVGRNTLPAIAFAASRVQADCGDRTLVVLPSDHHLDDNALPEMAAADTIAGDYLVTFGIYPRNANTGYGYIAAGAPLPVGFQVREFREKPDQATAERYIKEGYLWNSGMFLLSSRLFREELSRLCPEISCIFDKGVPDYTTLPSLSFDYGLLERSDRVAVVPLHAEWSDLGTFRAWYEFFPHDPAGNCGKADYLDSTGNYVIPGGKKAALVGVSDLVVANSGDAILICSLAEAERVGDVVKMLKARSDPISEFHTQVFRPWGSYTDLERSSSYRIKRVTVRPGERLSLQLHHHRSEHWVVVSGTADVTLGEQHLQLSKGESTYVPCRALHRLANPGKIPLEVIEVQIGDYLEEDDIVRFIDDYDRI